MYTIKTEKVNEKHTLHYIVAPEGYPHVPGCCGNEKDAKTICDNMNKRYVFVTSKTVRAE